jgi:membrane protease YdiL (CAAX protease family)
MRVPQRFWIGLVAAVFYVALAGGVGELLKGWAPEGDDVAELALSHFTVLIPLIIVGVVFVRRAGWSRDVWRTPSSFETRPRRRWMLVFPILLLVQVVVILAGTPWSRWTIGLLLLVLLVNILVGVGEELYFRGILRASLRAHHGETLTLLVTSLLFGLAHALGSVIAGMPIGFIGFQVGVTAVTGAVLYGVFRATGRLWVAMALHALNDFALRVSSGDLGSRSADDLDPSPANIAVQSILWVFAVVLLISCIREDRRARREKTDAVH